MFPSLAYENIVTETNSLYGNKKKYSFLRSKTFLCPYWLNHHDKQIVNQFPVLLISDLIDNVYQRSRSRRTTSKSYKRKGIERKELKSYIINLSEDIACLWDVAHENYMIGTKKKWLTVKSMYRCKRNKVSEGTITYRGGQHLSRQDLFIHGKIIYTKFREW